MLRDRFLSRSQWEKKLRKVGAQPLEGKGKLNTAEWWHLPKGAPFTVPVEDETGRADFWAIKTLCDQLAAPRIFKALSPSDDDDEG